MKGFTLIELLIVITLMAILAVLAFPYYDTSFVRVNVETAQSDIAQTMRRAQSKAMAGENGSAFGVRILNDAYVLFQGDSYETRVASYDERFPLSRVVSTSGIIEVSFQGPSGSPSAFGALTMTDTQRTSKQIIVEKNGLIREE